MAKLISERKFDQDQVEKLNRSIIELCARESCNFEKPERAIIFFSGRVKKDRLDKCKHVKEAELATNVVSAAMNVLSLIPFFGPTLGNISSAINSVKTATLGYLREQWGCDGIATDEIKDMIDETKDMINKVDWKVDRNYELIRRSLVAINKNYRGKFN